MESLSSFQDDLAPLNGNAPLPTVQVQHLDHHFGKGDLRKQILFDVSLTLAQGEVVILTGPSGSGKSTLLTLMGGLRAVQTGSLQFLGQELAQAGLWQREQVRRQVGYIFQAHNLHGSLTALQNVMMGLEVQGHYDRRQMRTLASQQLEQVGLGDYGRTYPNQLSGGQKQRVAVARALVSRPALVLADEPTAALDGRSGREVVTLMQQLAREQGCTILLVTHDSRILDVADRIVGLEDGRLVA
jgi:putative ABC transport system ATP-binding protein